MSESFDDPRDVLAFQDDLAESNIEQAREEYAVPATLQRDTPEDTIAALAKSYAHGTRKISEQGEEIARLRGLVAEYESAQTVLPEPYEDYGWQDEQWEQPLRSPEELAQQAASPQNLAAARAYFAQPEVQAAGHAIRQNQALSMIEAKQMQTQQTAVVEEGFRMAVAQNPGIADKAAEITQLFSTNPEAHAVATSAMQTGNPLAMADAIKSAYNVLTPVNNTAMKLAAQSASGATGRLQPSGPDRWDEIRNAPGGRLDL